MQRITPAVICPGIARQRINASFACTAASNPLCVDRQRAAVARYAKQPNKLNTMRAPSIKTITSELNLTSAQARLIRALIKGDQKTLDPVLFPGVHAWVASCYHLPTRTERIMACISEVMQGHGVEAIDAQGIQPRAVYVNTGDTYTPTVLYCYRTRSYRVQSWGDYLEAAGI
jgi:hypothetical protein